MANHKLRTVIAVTLDTIHQNNGYLAPTKNATENTQTKVLTILGRTPLPSLDEDWWRLADEIIGFFYAIDTMPDFKKILATLDGPMYQACCDIAKSDEITSLNFAHAVAMPFLYTKLNPKPPKELNASKTEAKIAKPGEFMGKINEPERFFVKLVQVGPFDVLQDGNTFDVQDRSKNLGVFYGKIDKFETIIKLGDCFAIHATPTRHVSGTTNNYTIFRNVEVLKDTIVIGAVAIESSKDSTGGKFIRRT